MCTHFYFFINIFLFAEDRKNVKQTVYSTKEVSQGFSCRIFARGIIVPLTRWIFECTSGDLLVQVQKQM